MIHNLSGLRTRLPAQQVFHAGLACLLILSEIFSSNIQQTLPAFSTLCRAGLTVAAILLLAAKCFLLTEYSEHWQPPAAAAALAAAAAWALYGGDRWFFLAMLCGLAAKDIDLRRALRVYLAVAAAGLILVQLLHLPGLVPFRWYCRNWDFGYGHYNGYGARLIGIFFAWGWLRFRRMRWFDWAGLIGLLAYTWIVPHCRGAAGGMAVFLLLAAADRLARFLPAAARAALHGSLFRRLWHGAVLALVPLLTAGSVAAGYFFDTAAPDGTPLLKLIDRVLSGRFEIWHNVFWQTPLTLFGGIATDGDEHHAIDNVFLALWMNKGVIGALLVLAALLVLLWRLCRAGCTAELVGLVALIFYCVMENRLFLVASNPFLLLLPCLLCRPAAKQLPVLPPPA